MNVNPPAATPVVARLLASTGTKGDPVASYQRSIVFLPRECEAGKEYRVRLDPIGRTDVNNRPMYRGVPASDENSGRWVENQDGTLSNLWVITNWKLAESIQVMETRTKAQEDGTPRTTTSFRVSWGHDLASSMVEEVTTGVVPVLEEYVRDGQLLKKEVSTRPLPEQRVLCPIHRLEWHTIYQGETWVWYENRFRTDWGNLSVQFVVYRDDQADHAFIQQNGWFSLPVWMQAELEAPYPVCACNRARVDTKQGHSVCAMCTEERGVLGAIEEYLPPARRQELALVAEQCFQASEQGRALEGETGLAVAQALTGHRSEADLRDWADYAWYYILPDAVIYASRFSPSAMMILSGLPQARAAGLVMLAAWLPCDHKASSCSGDFYDETQNKGHEVPTPRHFDSLAHATVAVRLRGEESKRQEAVQILGELHTRLGEHAPQTIELRRALESPLQDYAVALAIGWKHLEMVEDLVSGRAVSNFVAFERWHKWGSSKAWVMGPDGSLRESDGRTPINDVPRRGRYDGAYRCVWTHVGAKDLALVMGGANAPEGWEGSWYGEVFCAARHVPTEGLTDLQRQAVERLEQEHHLPPNAFGVNKALGAAHAKRLDEILRVAPISEAREAQERENPRLFWEHLTNLGTDGVELDPSETRRFERNIRERGDFSIPCGRRSAQELWGVDVADGRLMVVAYHKYGNWNVRMYWESFADQLKRALQTREPDPQPFEEDESVPPQQETSTSTLDLSNLLRLNDRRNK